MPHVLVYPGTVSYTHLAEAFHDFIANLKTEAELAEESKND